MESDWAAENLRVIRTLMERSAIYRRALAPMMLLAGSAGTVAATAGWLAFYGCALHAAGFFMPRGIKLFGWTFILGGCGLSALGAPDVPRPLYAHGVMGLFFGGLHLAYGIYLFCTEKRKNEA